MEMVVVLVQSRLRPLARVMGSVESSVCLGRIYIGWVNLGMERGCVSFGDRVGINS